jgi:hypothetical protein
MRVGGEQTAVRGHGQRDLHSHFELRVAGAVLVLVSPIWAANMWVSRASTIGVNVA